MLTEDFNTCRDTGKIEGEKDGRPTLKDLCKFT